jgi:hypothetical protein
LRLRGLSPPSAMTILVYKRQPKQNIFFLLEVKRLYWEEIFQTITQRATQSTMTRRAWNFGPIVSGPSKCVQKNSIDENIPENVHKERPNGQWPDELKSLGPKIFRTIKFEYKKRDDK